MKKQLSGYGFHVFVSRPLSCLKCVSAGKQGSSTHSSRVQAKSSELLLQKKLHDMEVRAYSHMLIGLLLERCNAAADVHILR
jgi:hypothetical protein